MELNQDAVKTIHSFHSVFIISTLIRKETLSADLIGFRNDRIDGFQHRRT